MMDTLVMVQRLVELKRSALQGPSGCVVPVSAVQAACDAIDARQQGSKAVSSPAACTEVQTSPKFFEHALSAQLDKKLLATWGQQ